MRPGSLPYLAAHTARRATATRLGTPQRGGHRRDAPTGPALIAATVRGADGWVFAANMDNQRERAYQIVFEAASGDGRRRARIETFTLGYDEAGNVVIMPEHVWVDARRGAGERVIMYAPPAGPSGVLSNVTPISFHPVSFLSAYVVPGQEFP